ncbi:MAG: ATP-binding protein, partial [Patescibacteria group bacterium]
NKKIDTKIPRSRYLEILKKNINNHEILLLLGSRRVGKTTIMKQWVDYLIKQKVNSKNILYLLLDHPELKNISLLKIVEDFYKLQNLSDKEKTYIFLDEIQYKKNWDQEVKALYETKNIKFILSGSAISLISRQKTFLTGRYLKYIVHPLDWTEFQTFTKNKNLLDYLQIGGYPEYVINRDPQYLLDLIDNIVYKDIVEVYKIRQPKLIKDMLLVLSRAVGFKISLNKIAKTLKISIETVKDYLRFLSEVYLIYEVPKFSTSLNEQIYNEKKYYFYDTGLVKILSGMDNMGSLAENMVANYLKNNNQEISYFYQDKKECDFIVKKMNNKGNFEYQPIEVKFNPDEKNKKDFDLKQKGLAGFYNFLEQYPNQHGLIVTNKIKNKHTNFKLISLESFLKNKV